MSRAPHSVLGHRRCPHCGVDKPDEQFSASVNANSALACNKCWLEMRVPLCPVCAKPVPIKTSHINHKPNGKPRTYCSSKCILIGIGMPDDYDPRLMTLHHIRLTSDDLANMERWYKAIMKAVSNPGRLPRRPPPPPRSLFTSEKSSRPRKDRPKHGL